MDAALRAVTPNAIWMAIHTPRGARAISKKRLGRTRSYNPPTSASFDARGDDRALAGSGTEIQDRRLTASAAQSIVGWADDTRCRARRAVTRPSRLAGGRPRD